MKLITTKVSCRGCNTAAILELKQPGYFSPAFVPFKCTKCGSKLLAEIRREWFQNKINIRVKMLAHTQTLLNMLKRRQASA
jgi:hypothetical protein